VALERRDGPTVLVFSRQNLPVLDRTVLADADGVRRGAYTLLDTSGEPEVILLSTGSEVHVAVEAEQLLRQEGVQARVVSMPSWELFDAQPAEYRDSVLPPEVRARVSVEAATTMGWERYIGDKGVAVGVSHFGASAPGGVIYEQLDLTARRVADEALKLAR
jgi:transketolase